MCVHKVWSRINPLYWWGGRSTEGCSHRSGLFVCKVTWTGKGTFWVYSNQLFWMEIFDNHVKKQGKHWLFFFFFFFWRNILTLVFLACGIFLSKVNWQSSHVIPSWFFSYILEIPNAPGTLFLEAVLQLCVCQAIGKVSPYTWCTWVILEQVSAGSVMCLCSPVSNYVIF